MANESLNQTAFEFWGPVYEADDGTLYSPGFTGNTYASNSWSTDLINGKALPGIVEVTVNKALDVDKKKASGSDGARLTLHGLQPAIIEIRVTIWTPEQLKELNRVWPILFPKAQKKKPQPF